MAERTGASHRPGGAAAFAAVVLVLLLTAAAGCLDEGGGGKKKDGSGGEGGRPSYALNLTYLDDTGKVNDTWDVLVSGVQDYGVLLVRNEGTENDSVELKVEFVTPGWDVKPERMKLDVGIGEVVPVVVTYTPGDGEGLAMIWAISEVEPTVSDMIWLDMVKGSGAADVTAKGDQVMVDYVLRDENGTQLDAGTLPATAGEPEAGPAGSLTYIDGFWLGLLGMEKGGGLLIHRNGETKTVKVPPELAYGTDPEAHELGGVWLYFTLTITASQ